MQATVDGYRPAISVTSKVIKLVYRTIISRVRAGIAKAMVGSLEHKSFACAACGWEVCDFNDTQRRITYCTVYIQGGVNLIHRQQAIAAETRYPIISRESVSVENDYTSRSFFSSLSSFSFSYSLVSLFHRRESTG